MQDGSHHQAPVADGAHADDSMDVPTMTHSLSAAQLPNSPNEPNVNVKGERQTLFVKTCGTTELGNLDDDNSEVIRGYQEEAKLLASPIFESVSLCNVKDEIRVLDQVEETVG